MGFKVKRIQEIEDVENLDEIQASMRDYERARDLLLQDDLPQALNIALASWYPDAMKHIYQQRGTL